MLSTTPHGNPWNGKCIKWNWLPRTLVSSSYRHRRHLEVSVFVWLCNGYIVNSSYVKYKSKWIMREWHTFEPNYFLSFVHIWSKDTMNKYTQLYTSRISEMRASKRVINRMKKNVYVPHFCTYIYMYIL